MGVTEMNRGFELNEIGNGSWTAGLDDLVKKSKKVTTTEGRVNLFQLPIRSDDSREQKARCKRERIRWSLLLWQHIHKCRTYDRRDIWLATNININKYTFRTAKNNVAVLFLASCGQFLKSTTFLTVFSHWNIQCISSSIIQFMYTM